MLFCWRHCCGLFVWVVSGWFLRLSYIMGKLCFVGSLDLSRRPWLLSKQSLFWLHFCVRFQVVIVLILYRVVRVVLLVVPPVDLIFTLHLGFSMFLYQTVFHWFDCELTVQIALQMRTHASCCLLCVVSLSEDCCS